MIIEKKLALLHINGWFGLPYLFTWKNLSSFTHTICSPFHCRGSFAPASERAHSHTLLVTIHLKRITYWFGKKTRQCSRCNSTFKLWPKHEVCTHCRCLHPILFSPVVSCMKGKEATLYLEECSSSNGRRRRLSLEWQSAASISPRPWPASSSAVAQILLRIHTHPSLTSGVESYGNENTLKESGAS